MDKFSVHRITEILGSDAICAELNVSPHSVRYAKYKGQFSSHWYGALSEMCEEVGEPCPKTAFSFRPRAKKIGANGADNKGQGGNSLPTRNTACNSSTPSEGV